MRIARRTARGQSSDSMFVHGSELLSNSLLSGAQKYAFPPVPNNLLCSQRNYRGAMLCRDQGLEVLCPRNTRHAPCRKWQLEADAFLCLDIDRIDRHDIRDVSEQMAILRAFSLTFIKYLPATASDCLHQIGESSPKPTVQIIHSPSSLLRLRFRFPLSLVPEPTNNALPCAPGVGLHGGRRC